MATLRTVVGFTVALSVFGALAEGANADEFVIVSDVDDTVKITNVLNRTRAIRNAIKSELAFAGMSELYRELLGHDSRATRLRFISGSPRVLTHEIREMLAESRFPAYALTVRGFRESRMSAFHLKTKKLNLLYGDANGQFILIGDDTESDPEAYADFAASRPDQVLATYIRRITGRPLPAGQVPFVTAYDIAIREHAAGRLTSEQLALVGNAVLSASSGTLLPDFQVCPTQFEDLVNGSASLLGQIQDKLGKLCQSRATDRPPSR